jgi:UPF0755 protein
MFRNLFRLILLAVAVALLVFSFLLYGFFNKPLVANQAETSVIIKAGSSLNSIAEQLNQQGFLEHPSFFVAVALFLHNEHSLRAGEYAITPGMTAPQLLSNMVKGKVILHKLTLVDGWTFKDFRRVLDENAFLDHTTVTMTDAEILKALSVTKKSPEGLFYSETYLFTRGDADLKILQMAYKEMQESLSFQWKARAKDLPYLNSYQALIAASIIEKETANLSDRARVSGVIMRRLNKGMRLQIDATVYYGLNEPQTYKLTKLDLQKDTPYNTYLHSGLPPTPICMPSEKSIYAALHPDNGNSLYYVARGDGTSEFSATYSKHQTAITQYLKTPSLSTPPAP